MIPASKTCFNVHKGPGLLSKDSLSFNCPWIPTSRSQLYYLPNIFHNGVDNIILNVYSLLTWGKSITYLLFCQCCKCYAGCASHINHFASLQSFLSVNTHIFVTQSIDVSTKIDFTYVSLCTKTKTNFFTPVTIVCSSGLPHTCFGKITMDFISLTLEKVVKAHKHIYQTLLGLPVHFY